MLNNMFLKTLRDQRRSILYWGIGLIGMAVMMAAFYPTIKNMPSVNAYLQELPQNLKELFSMGGLTDYSSPVGYFSAELFSFMVPLLLLVFGVGFGANAIAGDEEKGTLGFLLANPVPRWRVVVDKFGVLLVSMLVLGMMFWAGMAVCVLGLNIDLSLLRLAEATFGAMLVALVFSSLAFMLGCVKGNKGMSMGIAGGLAVLTYFLNGLGGMVSALKDYRFLSPFYHYVEPNTLANGISPEHVLVLIGLTVVFFAISIPAFMRRDIAV
ncbi:MAG: ABC transporter permease subunit [Dehalococcoidales bacterium]|nr:ABC transporter permease subunit [Dehalococcoidales bacterium]